MKRAGVTLVVLLCLFLGADFLLRAAAENAAAKLIDERIPVRVEPDVGLGKFPFLMSVVTGKFDEVTIDIPKAAEGGLVVEDIHLTLEDVELEALEVLAGRGNLRAESLRGEGIVSERTVNDLIAEQAPGIAVNIQDGRVNVSRDGIEVPANAVIAANRILIGAGEVLAPLEIPLPALLEGVQFTTLRAESGRLVLGVIGSQIRVRS